MIISFREKDYMYSYNKMPPHKFRMHLHNYFEFLYFQQGCASYMVEYSTYTAEPGDIFITRPQELHTIVFHSDEIYERQFIQISSSLLSYLEFDLLSFINQRPLGEYNVVKRDLVEKYNLGEYFTKVQYYILNRLPESDLMIKTYIIQFLVHLNKAFLEEAKDFKLKDKKNSKIDTIIEYLDDNVENSISLDNLAEIFYINKYHMCHIFKESTGLSIKEYINTRRIALAKNLLSTGQDITSICFQCGFNDYSSFYKTFKKLTGKSPREFLKKGGNTMI